MGEVPGAWEKEETQRGTVALKISQLEVGSGLLWTTAEEGGLLSCAVEM